MSVFPCGVISREPFSAPSEISGADGFVVAVTGFVTRSMFLAIALTFVPACVLEAGTVTTPLSASMLMSEPAGTDHFLLVGSFVAVTVCSIPSTPV